MKSPGPYLKDAHGPQSTHSDSRITGLMIIMIIPNLGTTCHAHPTMKKIAKLRLLSTSICARLQSTNPQPTNPSSASSSALKTNSDMMLQIT
uniref:Uncharacterized protein n=1 Tax=Romanomermis culicivorax TaxID=13658 RepID=A0A915IEC3_ROMCU